ncbi:pyridoxamine 5'-phosphate oxidase family protein [Nocardia sp. NPDC056000]|uniref:pyridoxamine 5'-phosphate oxidase family protein n=1 Tax=Nocardia sp. NPDC056000 TaxID=3345674 RepID=UPI0035E20A70
MSEGPHTAELFEIAAALLRANTYGFLITIGDEIPNARLVQHVGLDDDGTIWIGTSPKSRKAADIAAHPKVTYAVQDRDTPAYVSVHATAEIVDDLATRKERWINGFEKFFPAGPDGDDFVLLRLRPHAVEVMDFARQIHPDPFGLLPARAVRD